MRRKRGVVLGAVASIIAVSGLAIIILASVLVSVGPGVRASNQWITIVNYSYTPSDITVNVGDTVTWQNNASATAHTATSTSAPSGGAFDSGIISAGGGIWPHVFTVTGSYSYHCTLHIGLMSGTITVNPAIPEFSSFSFVVVGLMVMMLGLVFARRHR